VVIHGHFYQPPREDPWLEEVEAQPSAAPYHDWNARVNAECYRSVVAARIPGEEGRIQEIINALRFISFNFGPTLLTWMEREAPRTYRAILEADRLSRTAHGGHGNALAQAYHHTILPLASRRDKITEVRWGMEDFRRRFGRDPEGMWLPETAVDDETLDVLAQEGIRFTIVAPHQVEAPPRSGLPGLYRTGGGRYIALFVYDGPLSHDVAFGHLLKDAETWVARMARDPGESSRKEGGLLLEGGPGAISRGETAGPGDRVQEKPEDSVILPRKLVALATDGETYGHHHRFGEMALAAAIHALRSTPGIRLENFATFLNHSPARDEVALVEPSSWSCPHGVERWRGDCGCKMNPGSDTQQEWRTGLRDAMTWLAEGIHRRFEIEAPPLLGDPWEARNEYGRVVGGAESLTQFLSRKLPASHTGVDRVRAGELLESERNALRLFTSCGWFFDDLAGIEPIQILRYAARALDLLGPGTETLGAGFLARLRTAVSNEDPPRDGSTLFLQEASPPIPPHRPFAAGTMALAREGVERPTVHGFRATVEDDVRIRIVEAATGRSRSLGVNVEGSTPQDLRFRVRELTPGDGKTRDDAKEEVLTVQDLPEPLRLPLEDMVLKDAIRRWVPPAEQAALLAGSRSLTQVLAQALVSALGELSEQGPESIPDRDTVERVAELARLHTRRGLPIPFDVQTDFFDIFETASPERRGALSALRHPLGFTTHR